MKILFINISDIKGGAAKSMWRIGEELSETHEVHFLVRSKFTSLPKVTEIGRNKYINILFNLLGMQYKFLPVSRKIVKFARRWKPDIISINQIEGGYFQTRDLIKLGEIAPLVWTMHDLWAFMENAHREPLKGEKEKNIYPQIGLPLGGWLLNRKYRIYGETKFSIIFPSEYLSTYKPPDLAKDWVIPHGIDLTKFHPKRTKRMLFVAEKTSKGELKPILDRLNPLLREKVILTIIGEGKFNEYYDNIIIDAKGYIEDEDELIYYYRDADVFIYPSKADVFGLVCLESLACGTPVIAYEVGGISEVIGKGGFLIKPWGYADFAFKIFTVLNNPRLRAELSERAEAQSLKFDIKKIVKQYEQLFEELWKT